MELTQSVNPVDEIMLSKNNVLNYLAKIKISL